MLVDENRMIVRRFVLDCAIHAPSARVVLDAERPAEAGKRYLQWQADVCITMRQSMPAIVAFDTRRTTSAPRS
jgi:hypothetical protein